MQWAWDDTENSRKVSANSRPALGMDNATDDHGEGGTVVTGLFPTRTAVILLGPPLPAGDGEGTPGGAGGGDNASYPSITSSRVLAVRADGLRRRASQLKVPNILGLKHSSIA